MQRGTSSKINFWEKFRVTLFVFIVHIKFFVQLWTYCLTHLYWIVPWISRNDTRVWQRAMHIVRTLLLVTQRRIGKQIFARALDYIVSEERIAGTLRNFTYALSWLCKVCLRSLGCCVQTREGFWEKRSSWVHLGRWMGYYSGTILNWCRNISHPIKLDTCESLTVAIPFYVVAST